jgi:hypothetical protein
VIFSSLFLFISFSPSLFLQFCLERFDMGVGIGAGARIDMGRGEVGREGKWTEWIPAFGVGCFQERGFLGRWLWGFLKGAEEVWLVGWVGTDTGEYFAGMGGLDVLCCIHGTDFREYTLVLA